MLWSETEERFKILTPYSFKSELFSYFIYFFIVYLFKNYLFWNLFPQLSVKNVKC